MANPRISAFEAILSKRLAPRYEALSSDRITLSSAPKVGTVSTSAMVNMEGMATERLGTSAVASDTWAGYAFADKAYALILLAMSGRVRMVVGCWRYRIAQLRDDK